MSTFQKSAAIILNVRICLTMAVTMTAGKKKIAVVTLALAKKQMRSVRVVVKKHLQ